MGNFFSQTRPSNEYNKIPIVFMRTKKSMEDVHEVVEYIRNYYATKSKYSFEEFEEVFQSFFENHCEEIFKDLENKHNIEGEVDIYETVALMSLINNDEFERRLDYIFRLFDFNQNNTLDLSEFILTLQTVIKGLCKIVNLEPPQKYLIDQYANEFFEKADADKDQKVTMQEFVNFVKYNWQLQDWFLKYADLQTFENAERRHNEKMLAFQKLFPNYKNIKNTDDHSALIADLATLQPNLERLLKSCKKESVDLLINLLVSTSNYVNPSISEGFVNYEAYKQVIKAWAAFDACDINQDNTIDINELEFMIFAIEGDKPSKLRLQKELQIIDSDKSGMVDRKEWIEYLCIDPNNSGKMVFREGLRTLFDFYDKDNSGFLDKREITELVRENLQKYLSRYEQQGGRMPLEEERIELINEIVQETIKNIKSDQKSDDRVEISWANFKNFMEDKLLSSQILVEFMDEYK